MADTNGRQPAWKAAAEEWSKLHVPYCCCNGARYVRGNFPLGHILFGKAIPCACLRSERARERGERLRRMSGLSEAELSGFTFEGFDPRLCRPQSEQMQQAMADIKRQCEEYARNPRGWLVLVGNVGSGKTHLAAAIARYSIHHDRPAYMATMPRLLNMLRAGYNDAVTFEQRVQMLEEVDLLVIDDLGAEKATEWAIEQLYSIVNARYHTRRPMVITSNVDLERADGVIDARVLSRLREGTLAKGWSKILTLPCTDARPYVKTPVYSMSA